MPNIEIATIEPLKNPSLLRSVDPGNNFVNDWRK